MIDRILYYIQLISEACGYNGSEGNTLIGWFIVLFSIGLVIAAYYYCITLSIWPGEEANDHIKRRILLETDDYNEN